MENQFPKASFVGELKFESISVPCYVLENNQRLIAKDGIQRAMGYEGKSENWLSEFMSHLNRLTHVDPDLLDALAVSVQFQIAKPNGSFLVKEGTLPETLLKSCNAIIRAKNEGFLFVSELKFAKSAEIIVRNFNFAETEKAIDFASGLELFKSNHKEVLSRFMSQNLEIDYFIWIKTFPDEFFEHIFKFKQWSWTDLNANAAEVADFLNNIIFTRLDESVISIIQRNRPRMKYRKQNSSEKYLQNPELSTHLNAVQTLIKIAENEENLFSLLLNNAFPKQRNFRKLNHTAESRDVAESDFEQLLKKSVKNR